MTTGKRPGVTAAASAGKEEKRMETEQKQPVHQEKKAPASRGRTILLAVILALAVLVIGFAGYSLRNAYRYESAVSLLKDAQYTPAADAFEALGHYRDAASYALYSRAAAAGEVCYAVELSSGSLRFCRECLREKRSLAEHLEMLGAEVRRC